MTNVVEIPVEARKRGTRARCCSSRALPLDPRHARRLSDDLGLLANKIRLQLIALMLADREPVCVCDLVGALRLKQPTISHHLKLLKEGGIVDSERRGVWSYWFVRREELARFKRSLADRLEEFA